MRLVRNADVLVIGWKAGETAVVVQRPPAAADMHVFASSQEAMRRYKAMVAEARADGYRTEEEAEHKRARQSEEHARSAHLTETRESFNRTHKSVHRWAADEALKRVPLDARIVNFTWGESCAWGDDVRWKGDLVLDDVETGDDLAQSLLFLADLVVDGDVVNADGTAGKNLFVAGTLRARNLIAGGAVIWTRSSVELTGCLYAHYNDGQLLIGGGASAKALVWEEHQVDIDGEIVGKVVRVARDDDEKVIRALRKGRNPFGASRR